MVGGKATATPPRRPRRRKVATVKAPDAVPTGEPTSEPTSKPDASSEPDASNSGRILKLRQHITEQHALLVEQQDALRRERAAHTSTTTNIQKLVKELDELEHELDTVSTERCMQRRHVHVLTATLTSVSRRLPFELPTANDGSGAAAAPSVAPTEPVDSHQHRRWAATATVSTRRPPLAELPPPPAAKPDDAQPEPPKDRIRATDAAVPPLQARRSAVSTGTVRPALREGRGRAADESESVVAVGVPPPIDWDALAAAYAHPC